MIKPWNIWNETCLWILSVSKPIFWILTFLENIAAVINWQSRCLHLFYQTSAFLICRYPIVPPAVNSSLVNTEWSLICCWTKAPVRCLCYTKTTQGCFSWKRHLGKSVYVFKVRSFIILINFELIMFNIMYLLFNVAPLWWET